MSDDAADQKPKSIRWRQSSGTLRGYDAEWKRGEPPMFAYRPKPNKAPPAKRGPKQKAGSIAIKRIIEAELAKRGGPEGETIPERANRLVSDEEALTRREKSAKRIARVERWLRDPTRSDMPLLKKARKSKRL
jgi:hypothetical protein